VNLTTHELTELPLPAAAFDAEDDIIAQTPEWVGSLPGAVSYPVRHNRLVIATGETNPACEAVLSRLLDAIDDTENVVSGSQAMQVRMLATSLRLLAGRKISTQGSSHDVIDYARAGIAARTSLEVQVEGKPAYPVQAPEVAALVLVQFAANAERHARVTSVTISQQDNSFHVIWPGESGQREVPTARQHGARERWGMGFSRIAADTLGGALYPPYDRGDGIVTATLELGLNRLALPLAAVSGGRIIKGTRSWDEETGLIPRREINNNERLMRVLSAALERPHEITVTEGWWARAVRDRVWIAVPPDDIVDRARDVLDGIVHERALWDGVPEPSQSRVFALASLLGAMLGTPLPRVPVDNWNRRYPDLAGAFGVTLEVPKFEGLGAIDPRVVAYLACEFGDHFEVDGEDMYLHVRAEKMDDPFVRIFLHGEDNALRLS
jgi:hypothetical protein